MLEKADLILYAGSLVPKALTECHKSGAVVRSSADMNLEEQCALMKEHYERGHFIVRLFGIVLLIIGVGFIVIQWKSRPLPVVPDSIETVEDEKAEN